MNTKARSKSGLFLMELIIVIMFFSLSAAICMQIFANAKVKADYSRDVTNAAFVAESVAEIYKESNGNLESVAEKYKGTFETNAILVIHFDKEWQVTDTDTDTDTAKYTMTLTESGEGNLSKILIEIDADDEEIFNIVAAAVS